MASTSARKRTTSSSRARKPSTRAAKDVPASADLAPPPVKEPEPEPADPVAQLVEDRLPGDGLLGKTDMQHPGVVEQQDERVAVSIVRRQGDKELFDASTGGTPDPDRMFAQVGHSGTVFECRVRLMERMWVNTHSTMERLVIPAGRQVSGAAAAQIVDVVRRQAEQQQR